MVANKPTTGVGRKKTMRCRLDRLRLLGCLPHQVGQGKLLYRAANPAALASQPDGDNTLVSAVEQAVPGSRVRWHETNHLLLRRGPYVIAAGLEESPAPTNQVLHGPFIDLFDSELSVQETVTLKPGNRYLLMACPKQPAPEVQVLASACKVVSGLTGRGEFHCTVEGIAETPGIVLLRLPAKPLSAELDSQALEVSRFDPATGLAWFKFSNQARPRELLVRY